MPQPAMSSSVPPSVVTQSAMSSVPGLSCSAAPSSASGCSEPVDVSPWTTASSVAPGLSLERLEQARVGDVRAPVLHDLDDLAAGAARELDDAAAEVARRADDDRVARLGEADEAGLHAGRAGRLQRQHEALGVAVDEPQHAHDLVQDRGDLGIEMAEHRLLHRGQRGRRDVGRPGTAEQPIAGGQWGGRGVRHSGSPCQRRFVLSTGLGFDAGDRDRCRARQCLSVAGLACFGSIQWVLSIGSMRGTSWR